MNIKSKLNRIMTTTILAMGIFPNSTKEVEKEPEDYIITGYGEPSFLDIVEDRANPIEDVKFNPNLNEKSSYEPIIIDINPDTLYAKLDADGSYKVDWKKIAKKCNGIEPLNTLMMKDVTPK